jgi:putative ABC transport system substrate-binding protein
MGMRRREFITLLGNAAAAAVPLPARAQQKVWKVGILSALSRQAFFGLYAEFIKGMRELGHIEGNDFVVEWRSAEEHYERFPELIAELVGLKVDLIITATSAAYRAAAGNRHDSNRFGLFNRSGWRWIRRHSRPSRCEYYRPGKFDR